MRYSICIAFVLCWAGVFQSALALSPSGRLPLAEFAKQLECGEPFVSGESVTVSNDAHSLIFYPGRRKIKADGVEVWMNSRFDRVGANGERFIAKVDGELLKWAVRPDAEPTNCALRVMIDAGHGGVDSGAISADGSVQEKSLTLEMALMLGGMLRERGFEVCYTRTNDTAISKSDRVKLAKKKRAGLFVSIHCNKAPNIEACGAETFIMPSRGFPGTAEGSKKHAWQPGNRNDVENMMAAYEIQKALVTNGTFRVDRGVRRQAFHVLRAAQCPAVLVEVGFISHARELRKLTNHEWQERQMRAIADGVCTFSRRLCAYRRIKAEAIARRERKERQEREERRLAEEAAKAEERARQLERELAAKAAKAEEHARQLERQLAAKKLESERIARELAALERAGQDGSEKDGFVSEEAIYLMNFYELNPGGRALPHISATPQPESGDKQ